MECYWIRDIFSLLSHHTCSARIGGSYLGVEFVYEALKTDPEAANEYDVCWEQKWVLPRIGVFPPKWMVYFMENRMIWGFSHYFWKHPNNPPLKFHGFPFWGPDCNFQGKTRCEKLQGVRWIRSKSSQTFPQQYLLKKQFCLGIFFWGIPDNAL